MPKLIVPLSEEEKLKVGLLKIVQVAIRNEEKYLQERLKTLSIEARMIDREQDQWLASFGARKNIPLEDLRNVKFTNDGKTLVVLYPDLP